MCAATFAGALARIAHRTLRYSQLLSKNWSNILVALEVVSVVFTMHVRVRRMRHFADVKLREQYENKCLNECHEDAERHQQDWRKPRLPWMKARQCFQHLFIREQVTEQTDAKRKRANQVTDQLDGKDQRCDPPDRTGQVLQMTK